MLRHWSARRRRFAIGCGVVVILLGCWCGLIARGVLLLKADLEQLQAVVSDVNGGQLDLNQTQAHLGALRDDLVSLRSIAAPLLAAAPLLGWLPGIGYDAQSAPALVDSAIDLLDAGGTLISILKPMWPPRMSRSMWAELRRALPHLATVREAIDRTRERLNRIDPARLSPAIGMQIDRLIQALPLARSGLDLLDVAPDLLGLNRPKTYIVLIQNADELRPTGGFISVVARVRLDGGEIVELDVRDSYQVDDHAHKPYGWAPEPLQEFMGTQMWVFRDANWSPDFPTSARKAAELYTYGLGVPVDGVIALDQQAVRDIVGVLGPIEVEPGQPPVDASNLDEYMRAGWAPPPDGADFDAWIASRKAFIGKLMHVILERLQSTPDQVDWAALGRAVYSLLQGRDVLIWLADPPASAVLAERGWDGAVRQTPGDYWMVADANLGFNKVNAVIESAVSYTVTLQWDGSALAEMTIHYTHSGPVVEGCEHYIVYTLALTYDTLIQTCYYDYLRLLAPLGAQLQSASAHPVPAEYLVMQRPFDGSTRVGTESGRAAFETFFVVERGRSLDVTLVYHLPSLVTWTAEGGQYTLTVQKQPGAKPYPVSVTLIGPDGYGVSHTSLPPVSVDTKSASFAFDLVADQTLSVTWSRK